MLSDDHNFALVTSAVIGESPFHALPDCIMPDEAHAPETLCRAFQRVMHCGEAWKVANVVFIWAVDRPYTHETGNRLVSRIAYIEMTTGILAKRWPTRYFLNITTDYDNKGEAAPDAGFEELANKDKNYRFYSKLISEYGPLRIWYATLPEINDAAGRNMKASKDTVRSWEKALIQGYRNVHGERRRPLKNRCD